MRNADKPAMPIQYPHNGEGRTGLTKREMFAMHIAGHIVSGDDGYNEYVVKSKMRTAVGYADALLAELEK